MKAAAKDTVTGIAVKVVSALIQRKSGDGAVSTKWVIARFRERMPNSPLTDDEIVELIVFAAIQHCSAVQFDHRAAS